MNIISRLMPDPSLSLSLPLRRQLSLKVVAMLIAALFFGLAAAGTTLYLSWQLEGGAAAINSAGSLRMRTYRTGLTLEQYSIGQPGAAERLAQGHKEFNETLRLLRDGDPTRPLYLPNDDEVRSQFSLIERGYQTLMTNWTSRIDAAPPKVLDQIALRTDLDEFVSRIDTLVLQIEHYNARRTFLLRALQTLLIGLAIVGTITQIYLMFLFIFRPLAHLRQGIARMATKDFSVHLPTDNRDEFGELARDFNHMADRLADAYGTLEARVEEKTSALNKHNQELALLYDIAAFLNNAQGAQDMCRGFLDRIMNWFDAQGGSVRIVDPLKQVAYLLTYKGISEKLATLEQCLQPGDCLCGESLRDGVAVIHDLRRLPEEEYEKKGITLACKREGFSQISAFPIRTREAQSGLFTLHFGNNRPISTPEMQMLDTLGRHLGFALENLRLAAREREMAVSEERNLLAQGLHDSIAQGLSFLNLQVQMLDDSLARDQTSEARELIPLLREGVQESYDDVRELLLNFRTRLKEGDLETALHTVVEKFRSQTGMTISFKSEGNGAPLPLDDQLQLLFIAQEALSNVRKHAQATHVDIRYTRGPTLMLEIRDNGYGLNADEVTARSDNHVGLRIMRERAARLGAQLELNSSERGVCIRVVLQRPLHHDNFSSS